eukprot:scaffold3598_cov148-Skeletonema_dohrnii-CCMP3373.AAC.3
MHFPSLLGCLRWCAWPHCAGEKFVELCHSGTLLEGSAISSGVGAGYKPVEREGKRGVGNREKDGGISFGRIKITER